MLDVVPPLLKSLMISRSPATCVAGAPVRGSQKPVPPPTFCGQSTAGVAGLLSSSYVVLTAFWKNQKPCCASPLLSKRSEPKYRTSQVVSPAGAVQATVMGKEYRAAKESCRLS